MSPGHSPTPGSVRILARLLLVTLPWVPVVAAAWPAIQDPVGNVYLCDSRPDPLPDGRWACRGPGGIVYVGALVEVARPGAPPGVRPWDIPRGPPYRYVPYPWGPPPREPSGYDALDPWLGRPGGSER
jgi:hypothetical protein